LFSLWSEDDTTTPGVDCISLASDETARFQVVEIACKGLLGNVQPRPELTNVLGARVEEFEEGVDGPVLGCVFTQGRGGEVGEGAPRRTDEGGGLIQIGIAKVEPTVGRRRLGG
jgi:hypothetical protein